MKNISYTDFGKKLEAVRVIANLTQEGLAQNLCVGQQTVSRWEAGTSRPRLNDLEKMMVFFQIKGRAKKEWLSSLGYLGNKSLQTTPSIMSTIAFSKNIPFKDLSYEDFEHCIYELLTYIYPDPAKVHQYGSSGHKQKGIDIEVRLNEAIYYDFQCKRCEQFGQKKVNGAIQAYLRSADKKYIILSRIATPAARDEIANYPDWDIWDASDLSLKIRMLSPEKACKLVDRYFPGMRFNLLGIEEVGSWQTKEDFFRPYNDKAKFFNHKWSPIGQDENFKKITQDLDEQQVYAIFISGPGGSGKSKLLYDLSNHISTKHPNIIFRITLPTEKLTEQSIDNLGVGEKILVIDDAHEQKNIDFLFHIAANPNSKTKIIVLTRPYGFDRLLNIAAKRGLSDENILITKIKPLSEQQSTQLAQEVLNHFNANIPPQVAIDVAKLTRGSPFATVLGSYIVAKKGIHPSLLNNEERFKREILFRFENIIDGRELPLNTNTFTLQRLLGIIALIQPFNPGEQDFKRLIQEEIDPNFDETPNLLKLLIKNNILLKRGSFYQISPTPLADFIIEDLCILNETSSGLAERIFKKTSGAQLEKLIHNIGKITWRLSYANKSHGYILDIIWKELENLDETNFATPEEIINAITTVALYQPAKALAFADKLIREQKHLFLIPQILKHCAYNLKFVTPVCARLWRLGKNDSRSRVQYTTHPFNVLSELCHIEQNKPIEYLEPVVKFGLSLINEEDTWLDTYTPLDIISPILATTCDSTKSNGLTYTYARHEVIHHVVKNLRRTLVNELLNLLQHVDLRKSIYAAKILHKATQQYPAPFEKANQSALTLEFASTLREIKTLINNKKIHDVVLIKILEIINWHAVHGEKAIQAIANELLSLIPTDINFRTMRALIDGYGQRWKKDGDYSICMENWKKEMEDVAENLLRVNTTENLLEIIKSNLKIISSVHDLITPMPHIFIDCLLRKSIVFSMHLIDFILLSPKEELAQYAGSALSAIASQDRPCGIIISKKFMATKESNLLYATAQACSMSEKKGGEFSDEEIEIVRDLCKYDDFQLLTTTLYAVEKIGYINQNKALDIILSIDFKNDPKIADAALRILHPNKAHPPEYILNECNYKKILDKLYNIPQLEGHWLESFLSKASCDQPEITADFFMKRVDIFVTKDYSYKPFNYGVYLNVPFRFHETKTPILIMSRLQKWIQLSPQNSLFIKYSSKLFFTMFNRLEEGVLEFLLVWASSGSKNDLETVIKILSTEPNDFVINYPAFVNKILQIAEQFGQTCLDESIEWLFNSAISGSRSGEFGQPYPKDLFLKNESIRILEELSAISPAYQLYEDIILSSDESISRSKKDFEHFNIMQEEDSV